MNTGMKNISRVHMVDSWNGLKKVSVRQQTSNTGAMPDLKQDKLKALGGVVSLSRRFEGRFLWDFNCCNFCSSKLPEGSHMTRSLSCIIDVTLTPLKCCWSWLLLMVEVPGPCGLCLRRYFK